MEPVALSIIMPVFNTGAYVTEAVASVLNQQSTTSVLIPTFELLIIDDHSTDRETIQLLANLSQSDCRIKVITNNRSKGAAGARNTGINHASGEWLGFLDSDDIWFPNALAIRWAVVLAYKDAHWIGARFQLLKSTIILGGKQQFPLATDLMGSLSTSENASKITVLKTPFQKFGEGCLTGIMTVLLKRTLATELGMFNEKLPRSEDYYLWFKCALRNDLFFIDAEIAFYRIHFSSLTHGKTPRFLHEDTMIATLLKEPLNLAQRNILLMRYDLVMQDHCYFYRNEKQFFESLKIALKWIKKRPYKIAGWKELFASSFKIG